MHLPYYLVLSLMLCNQIYATTNEVISSKTQTLLLKPIELDGYVIRDGKVYFNELLIENSDPKSLEVFGNTLYAKDDQHVYYKGIIESAMDSKTFHAFSTYTPFGVPNIFYFNHGKLYNDGKFITDELDPKSFSVSEPVIDFSQSKFDFYYFLRDNHSIYRNAYDKYNKMDVNINQFRIVPAADYQVGKGTCQYVVISNSLLVGQMQKSFPSYLDLKTFECLGNFSSNKKDIHDEYPVFYDAQYSRDNDYVYYNREHYPGISRLYADRATFRPVTDTVNYAIDKDYAYYQDQKIINADVATFEVISNPQNMYTEMASGDRRKNIRFLVYSKDKNTVFFKHNAIPEADPLSFQSITEPFLIRHANDGYYKLRFSESTFYGVDRNYAYYNERVINGADSKTFSVINAHYSKDKSQVYFQTKPIVGVDRESFKTIYETVMRDKNHVYIMGEIIPDVTPDGFMPIKNQSRALFQKDFADIKSDFIYRVYFDAEDNALGYKKIENIELADLDKNKVHQYNSLYFSFNNKLYFDTDTYRSSLINPENVIAVPAKDLASFSTFSGNLSSYYHDEIIYYAKNKDHVYYRGVPMPQYDANTFNIIPSLVISGSDKSQNDYYVKDKKGVYFNHKIIIGMDPDTVQLLPLIETDKGVLNCQFVKDKNNVFVDGLKVELALDAASFSCFAPPSILDKDVEFPIKTIHPAQYVYDKDSVLYADHLSKLSKLEGADPKTFQPVPLVLDFALDHKNVYYKSNLIADADIKTFKVIQDDKNLYASEGFHGEINRLNLRKLAYSHDDTSVFFKERKIPNADPLTFRQLAEPKLDTVGWDTISYQKTHFKHDDLFYAADKKSVYYNDTVIQGADAATISITMNDGWPNNYYIKDKYHVYYRDQIVEDADVDTFQTVGFSIMQDKQYLYFKGKKLPNVMAAFFKIKKWMNGDQTVIGKDEKNNVWYKFSIDYNNDTDIDYEIITEGEYNRLREE